MAENVAEWTAATVHDVFKLVADVLLETGATWWFRGQPSDIGGFPCELRPSVYRNPSLQEAESSMLERFRCLAPTRHTVCPADNDHIGWMSLAQHHRLPTRLLDWTESLITAIHFATVEAIRADADAQLWMLSPTLLNAFQGDRRREIHTPTDQVVTEIARIAFTGDSCEPPCRCIAFKPKEIATRMLVQQTDFTLHGVDEPLEALNGAQSYLRKVTIPQESLASIHKVLQGSGMTEIALFPDLDALADWLKAYYG